jgi:hypothetical protein
VLVACLPLEGPATECQGFTEPGTCPEGRGVVRRTAPPRMGGTWNV